MQLDVSIGGHYTAHCSQPALLEVFFQACSLDLFASPGSM